METRKGRGLASVILAAALGGPMGASAQVVAFPSGLVLGPDGSAVIVADRQSHVVYRVELATGALTTVAGTGEPGFSGDGGPATDARLQNPEWLHLDADGDLYIADRGNHRVRVVDGSSGTITTVVGDGTFAYQGDGGPALEASLTNPFGITMDGQGNLFIFDTEAHVVRRVDRESGRIETVIGTGEEGFGGDGGSGRSAQLRRPHNGAFRADGVLVFGDSFNQRIRTWDPETDVIETIGGTGESGPPIPGASALESPFMYFGAMVPEPVGSLVFTGLDNRIWRVQADGTLAVVAGTGEAGYSGDGGPAADARLSLPYGIVITPGGDIVFADASNRRIRRIRHEDGVIETVVVGDPGR